MAFPVTLLRNWADCDQTTEALNKELRVFNVSDQVLDLRADQAEDRADTRAQELADAQGAVARLTPLVAGLTAGSDEHTVMSRLLTRATRLVEDRTGTAAPAATGPAAFGKAVDVAQVQAQVPVLQTALTEVAAHRLTLSA